MPAKRRTTVLLADDNVEILERVAHILENANYAIVGVVPDGESLLQAFTATRPDVVVLDISMGALSGLDVARRLAQMQHPTQIVFLTVHEEAEFICAAFAAGATAYVVKSRLNSDLIDALHASAAGRIFVSPSLQHA